MADPTSYEVRDALGDIQTFTPIPQNPADASGHIPTGNVETVLLANPARRAVLLYCPKPDATIWARFTDDPVARPAGDGTAGCFQLPVDRPLIWDRNCPIFALSLFSAVVGDPFTVLEVST